MRDNGFFDYMVYKKTGGGDGSGRGSGGSGSGAGWLIVLIVLYAIYEIIFG